MNLILHVLLDAAVIFGLAYFLPQIDVKSFGTAIVIALVLGLLNFLLAGSFAFRSIWSRFFC